MITLTLFTVIMFITMTISGVIGFAGNVIALPLLSQILDLPTAVAVLALSSFVQAFMQAVQNRKHINWRELSMIVGFTCIGMPIGIFSLRYLPETALKLLLGLFILAVSALPFLVQLDPARQQRSAAGQTVGLALFNRRRRFLRRFRFRRAAGGHLLYPTFAR